VIVSLCMTQPKILLVEDDVVLQKLYSDILTSAQYTVDTAADGDIAFTKMMQGGWDLILLDMILPKTTGLELVKKIKETPPAIPIKKIVFLTNLEKGKEIDEATALGYSYLIKSNLNPDEFVNKVKSLLPQI